MMKQATNIRRNAGYSRYLYILLSAVTVLMVVSICSYNIFQEKPNDQGGLLKLIHIILYLFLFLTNYKQKKP